MRLTVDYLLVHEGDTDAIDRLVHRSLEDALMETEDISQDEAMTLVSECLRLKYSQPTRRAENRRVSAFRLDTEVEDDVAADFLESFEAALSSPETDDEEEEDSAKVLHILKFGNPLLKRQLANYADELFGLEMGLREALSAVFLIQYGDDVYDLLREVTVKVASKEKPMEAQMKVALENEFFHLLFSQYTQLNEGEAPTNVSQLLEVIGTAQDFEAFRRKITRHPIEDENHRDFIASLKERMDAIEKLRNCVAHNRAIPNRARENYEKARIELNQRTTEFLDSLSGAEGGPRPRPRGS